jgi:uncharacterized RDD family membrane protein YckC
MICPHCAFPNDPGVSVCSKCHKAFGDAPADDLAEVLRVDAQPVRLTNGQPANAGTAADAVRAFSLDEARASPQKPAGREPTAEPFRDSAEQALPPPSSGQAAARLVWVGGFWLRLLAGLIDVVAVTGVMGVMVMLSWLLRSGPEGALDFFVQNPKALLILAVMFLLLMGTYLTLFTRFGGQTLGQMLVGLQVIHESGRPLTTGQALRRLVGIAFAALPGMAGFLWVGFDLQRRGWHDYIGQSLVIRLRPPAAVDNPGGRLRDSGA